MCAAAVAWRVHMNLCSIRYENGGYISLPDSTSQGVRYPAGMYPNNIERKTNGERRPLASFIIPSAVPPGVSRKQHGNGLASLA